MIITGRQVLYKIKWPKVTSLNNHRDGVRREYGDDLFNFTDHPCGLLISNLTSQFFANIDLDRFDHFRRRGSSRGLRGGAWNNHASNSNNNTPTNENNNVGFRVARLPARPKETRDVSQV